MENERVKKITILLSALLLSSTASTNAMNQTANMFTQKPISIHDMNIQDININSEKAVRPESRQYRTERKEMEFAQQMSVKQLKNKILEFNEYLLELFADKYNENLTTTELIISFIETRKQTSETSAKIFSLFEDFKVENLREGIKIATKVLNTSGEHLVQLLEIMQSPDLCSKVLLSRMLSMIKNANNYPVETALYGQLSILSICKDEEAKVDYTNTTLANEFKDAITKSYPFFLMDDYGCFIRRSPKIRSFLNKQNDV